VVTGSLLGFCAGAESDQLTDASADASSQYRRLEMIRGDCFSSCCIFIPDSV
jgi:hypothetical protein